MSMIKNVMPSVSQLNSMMMSLGYHVVNTEKLALASNDVNYTPSPLDNVSARKFIVDLILNAPSVFHVLPKVVQIDRAICIDVVSIRPELLRLYAMSLRDDSNVIEACLKAKPSKNNVVFWSFVSPRLRQRKWLRDLAFNWSPLVFKYFTPKQRNNDRVGKLAFEYSREMYFYLSENLQNDWQTVLDFCSDTEYSLEDLHKEGLAQNLIAQIGIVADKNSTMGILFDFKIAQSSNTTAKRNKI